MSTELATLAPPNVIPKPTKAIVAAAMFERALEHHQALTKPWEAERDALQAAFKLEKRRCLRAATRLAADLDKMEISYSNWNEGIMTAKFSADEGVKALYQHICDHNNKRPTFDEAEVRKSIREELDTSRAQVASLLANPAALAAIDSLVEQALGIQSPILLT